MSDSRSLILVGIGGFGRELVDVVRSSSASGVTWELAGAVDDSPSEVNLRRLNALGIPFLGTTGSLDHIRPAGIVIGIGDPTTRRDLASRWASSGASFPPFVHPSAVLGSSTEIREGAVICAGASIGTNAHVGRFVHINPHAVVGHDTVVDDFASLNPNSTISGECLVSEGVLVGAAAVILQGLRIGPDAVVGAGACVTRDVEHGSTVVGMPARPRGER